MERCRYCRYISFPPLAVLICLALCCLHKKVKKKLCTIKLHVFALSQKWSDLKHPRVDVQCTCTMYIVHCTLYNIYGLGVGWINLLYTAVGWSTIFHIMCTSHLSVKQHLVVPKGQEQLKKFQTQKSYVIESKRTFICQVLKT